MPESANVQSIETLNDLRTALLRFGDEASSSLTMAEWAIRDAREWLRERRSFWQRESERCAGVLREATAALDVCLRSGDRDHPPDCHGVERTVYNARRMLQQAQEEDLNVQRWTRTFEETAASYTGSARTLSQHLEYRLPAAAATLRELATSLNTYIALRAPDSRLHPVRLQRLGTSL